jgi:hypothetical protein
MTGMQILEIVLLVLHLVGLAAVVFGVLAQVRRPQRRITAAVVHGATLQLLTGLALVGVLEAGDADVNHVKVGIKLIVALAVVGLAHSQRRKPDVAAPLLISVIALELVNVVVAVTV